MGHRLFVVAILSTATSDVDYFVINVVDEATGRGVPLVELKTVNGVRYYTDSSGIVAFREPGLMNQAVYFHVSSHGYEFPQDGFGYRGKSLLVRPGISETLRLRRVNIAERLYRVTGGGIYRDAVLSGRRPPLRQPLLNAQVFGSDSVVNAVYRGKIYWFWGDTNRASYPLGNFHVPGATSQLPDRGGLDPEVGVDLEYFLDAKGFAKETCHMPGPGPTWISGLVAIPDRSGSDAERLFASYVKVRNVLEVYERGLVEFDDREKSFKKVVEFPKEAPVVPHGHPLLVQRADKTYVYFANPFPTVRVPADPEALKDPARYEAFTCLESGSRLAEARIDRRPDGRVHYSWKSNTAALSMGDQRKLVSGGKLKSNEVLLDLQDVETGKPVFAHGGSVSWNPYRNRWVGIILESFGTSALGEVWYAEADTPVGPWVYARKIVTHNKYSFYNPKQHPMLAKKGGQIIFFEGTFSHTFSGNPEPTPWYDYNQMMYKLDLAVSRLILPVPIYRRSDAPPYLSSAAEVADRARWPIAFLALDRPLPGTVAVVVEAQDGTSGQRFRACAASETGDSRVVFYALPADRQDPPATSTALFEYVADNARPPVYTVDGSWSAPDYQRSPKPVCRVWRNSWTGVSVAH